MLVAAVILGLSVCSLSFFLSLFFLDMRVVTAKTKFANARYSGKKRRCVSKQVVFVFRNGFSLLFAYIMLYVCVLNVYVILWTILKRHFCSRAGDDGNNKKRRADQRKEIEIK